ncbi:MAG: HlyC/CorC family transporter [Planctomycetes bacterium]|nr:HlyC/CorC family transporter [Planctomycetota bacterium]
MFGFSAVDISLLAIIPVLLFLSGFFSGSETALFGLSETQRMQLRKRASTSSRAVEALLADQRMLLITVLLGNMTVNVLYFVISSVLLMKAETSAIAASAIAVLSLLLIILFGEVLPKLLASDHRIGFTNVIATPLLILHRVISPLRNTLEKLVITPLNRLTAPTNKPPQLDRDELAALLDLSSDAGVIDTEEERLLQDVINLGNLKVRDVMTPRVRVTAVPASASREDVIELVKQTKLTKLPVYKDDLDNIVGMLHVKSFLINQDNDRSLAEQAEQLNYVPEMATLDQLLKHFQESKTQIAIVVDEFGGTAGLVVIEDVVEEIVGDISDRKDVHLQPEKIDLNHWRVPGGLSVHEWADAFGQTIISPRIATVGGLITQQLGRAAIKGDSVEISNVQLDVEKVEKGRIISAIVTLIGEDGAESQ